MKHLNTATEILASLSAIGAGLDAVIEALSAEDSQARLFADVAAVPPIESAEYHYWPEWKTRRFAKMQAEFVPYEVIADEYGMTVHQVRNRLSFINELSRRKVA